MKYRKKPVEIEAFRLTDDAPLRRRVTRLIFMPKHDMA